MPFNRKGELVTPKISLTNLNLLSLGKSEKTSSYHKNLRQFHPIGSMLICKNAFSMSEVKATGYVRKR